MCIFNPEKASNASNCHACNDLRIHLSWLDRSFLCVGACPVDFVPGLPSGLLTVNVQKGRRGLTLHWFILLTALAKGFIYTRKNLLVKSSAKGMTQQSTKSDKLSSRPGNHVVEEKSHFPHVIRRYTMPHTHAYTHTVYVK